MVAKDIPSNTPYNGQSAECRNTPINYCISKPSLVREPLGDWFVMYDGHLLLYT